MRNKDKREIQQLDLIEFMESEGVAPLRLGTPKSDIPVDKPTDLDYDEDDERDTPKNP